MARNLIRNTRVFASTDAILTNGVPDLTKVSANNTFELKVLDGYSFSQETTTEDIAISEAGTTPIRGQKTYNVAQNPVDISLPMYIRPYVNTGALVDAPEKILWASASGTTIPTNASGDIVTNVAGDGNGILQTGTNMTVDFEESDANELAKLTLWFRLENTTYRIDEVNISGIEIDFSIDAIATISWKGMGTSINELSATDHATIVGWVAGTDYRPVPATSSNSFLRNKLSTLTLKNNQVDTVSATINGTADATSTSTTLVDAAVNQLTPGAYVGDYLYIVDSTTTPALDESRIITANDADTITVDKAFSAAPSTNATWYVIPANKHAKQEYNIAITGGSLTIENNMDFLTPEELGVVNKPLPGFAGARTVSGSITAYLNTGSYGTSALLQDILEDISSASNNYSLVLSIGGAGSIKKVELNLATAQLITPTINAESVISTEIKFAGQGSNGLLENQDEIVITYYAA